jgi:hypothetical protein
MRKSSTSLVFHSQADFRWNNIRFEVSDCCSQSRLNWHRYRKILLGGVIVGLSVATRYGDSKINAPISNLTSYHRILCVMVPSCDHASERDLEPSCLMADFLSLWPPYENSHLHSTKPHLWINFVGSLPWNLSCHPLVWNLVNLSLWASLSKVVCQYSTFLPTLSQSECIHYNLEGTRDSHIAIDRFQWPLLGCYLL